MISMRVSSSHRKNGAVKCQRIVYSRSREIDTYRELNNSGSTGTVRERWSSHALLDIEIPLRHNASPLSASVQSQKSFICLARRTTTTTTTLQRLHRTVRSRLQSMHSTATGAYSCTARTEVCVTLLDGGPIAYPIHGLEVR